MESRIIVRKFIPADTIQIARLLYETVHTVNTNDYSEEQVDIWAPQDRDLEEFEKRLTENNTYIAKLNGCIVGFGSITNTGHIDLLYTHKDYQNRGIATSILDQLEREALAREVQRISVEASITAAPFFKRKGYIGIRKQSKRCRGLVFINYAMYKHTSS